MKRLLLASALSLLSLTPALAAPDPAPQAKEAAREAKAKRQLLSKHLQEGLDHMEAGRRLLAPLSPPEGADPLPEAEQSKRKAKAKARYLEAAKAYQAAIELLPSVTGVPPERLKLVAKISHYNLACAHARAGQTDSALKALGKALELGYSDLERVEQDPDLSDIRAHPRFVNLLERVQARLAKQAMEAAAAELSSEALFPYTFAGTTLAGKKLSLADLKGKVVIVDYWGTWCPPCRMEIPHFVELAKRYEKDLVIVGMTWERGQTGPKVEAQVKAFAKKLGASYPMILLSKQADLAAVPNLEAFPTTLFIDRQGRVRAREEGYRDLKDLEKLVKALVKEGGKKSKEDEKKDEPKKDRPL
jgi:thiol-disulfide isomerase/thioredoxin